MDTTKVACVDVGGTLLKFGVLDGTELHARSRMPTAAPGPDRAERIAAQAATAVREHVAAHGPVGAVGIVVPGVVDTHSGIATWSENLGWRGADFVSLLEDSTGLPVAFGHDVRAGALAEATLGAAAGQRDVVFVAVGTGIAAGMVFDGVLYERPRAVGEIGHIPVGGHDRCVCGLVGCLETVSSAAAVARRYNARRSTGSTSAASVTAAEVAGLVAAGDPLAGEIWTEAIEGLAVAASWLAAALAPDMIVIGGGLAQSGALLLDPLRAAVADRLTFHHQPAIVASRFGEWAGCVGAGLLARELRARS